MFLAQFHRAVSMAVDLDLIIQLDFYQNVAKCTVPILMHKFA